MKKIRAFALGAVSLILVSCSNGVVGFAPQGIPDGVPFDAHNLNMGTMTFTPGIYKDVDGVSFPVNEFSMLTTKKDLSNGNFYAPANPAILFVNVTDNAGRQDLKTYNVGGFEYEATFRITDSSKTVVSGTSSKNEPQGVVLTAIWVDANKNPMGSIMLMCFADNAFPIGSPSYLDENVLLVMNYHDKNIAHLIACADVPDLLDADHTGTPKDVDFHKARLVIGSDATVNPTTGNLVHGPTISCYIDNKKVIEYKNTGTSHSVTGLGSTWDTTSTYWLTGSTKYDIAGDVLKISRDAPAYHFDGGSGISEYNAAWKNLVRYQGPTTLSTANLVTFGMAFQMGKKDDDLSYNKTRSPQIKNISIHKFTSP